MNEQTQKAVAELREAINPVCPRTNLVSGISKSEANEKFQSLITAFTAELEAAQTSARQDKRRYPIQGGPDVPWSAMAPHESQAQKNHGQSLTRLAERGGLGPGEAWAVVNGLECLVNAPWKEWEEKWRVYAERINLHFGELKAAQRERDNWKISAESQRDQAELYRKGAAALEAKLRYAKSVVEMLWHDDEMGYIVVGSIRECVKCGQKAETGKPIQHDPDCMQSPMEKVLYET